MIIPGVNMARIECLIAFRLQQCPVNSHETEKAACHSILGKIASGGSLDKREWTYIAYCLVHGGAGVRFGCRLEMPDLVWPMTRKDCAQFRENANLIATIIEGIADV